jgi:transcription elongation GreA/GreB family factor
VKEKVIRALIEALERELAQLTAAAQAAHEAATHEESRPEDQYDTRGLEASYLAGAQGARAGQIQATLLMFRRLLDGDLAPRAMVGPGSLVELERGGMRQCYLVVPQGGGAVVQVEGRRVQVITPASALGESLMDQRVGALIEVETGTEVREYRLVSVD